MNNSELTAKIEHVNLTVSNPDKVAEQLNQIFGWQTRWSGASLDGGRSVHIGENGDGNSYLALYTNSSLNEPLIKENKDRGHLYKANLNHIGILVSDLDEIEGRVLESGLKTFNHADYEPGRRFYFYIDDDIEVEVISYK